MIKAEFEHEGMLSINGAQDVILTEYTVITQVILKQLIRNFGKETAFEMLATVGKIAVKHIEKENPDPVKIQTEINEELPDED